MTRVLEEASNSMDKERGSLVEEYEAPDLAWNSLVSRSKVRGWMEKALARLINNLDESVTKVTEKTMTGN